MTTKTKEVKNVTTVTPSKGKATNPAKEVKKEKVPAKEVKPKSKKVTDATKKVIADDVTERELLYIYPETITSIKSNGEMQRKKKEWRQSTRAKIKTFKRAIEKADGPKAQLEAEKALRLFAKENLTSQGKDKFEIPKAPKKSI